MPNQYPIGRARKPLRQRASRQRLAQQGFTLVEMLVTIAVTTVVGGMVFLILNSGMVLYAKNTAVNSAHQQARSGVDQMLTRGAEAVSLVTSLGLEKAMNRINQRPPR